MAIWSVLVACGQYLVAIALVWAMRLSSRFRRAFARSMPGQTRKALADLYYGMWLVIALFLAGSTARILTALLGPANIVSAVMTGLTASLALLVAWNIALACWRLQRSL